MSARRNIRFAFLKWFPRKKKLKGSFIHRLIGDRIFEPRLWRLEPASTAAGFAVGTFIAFTPTFPVQMILAVLLSLWLRINLPAALAACWITNPLTMPIIIPLEYWLGDWVNSVLNLPKVSEFKEPLAEAENITRMIGHESTRRLWVTVDNVKALVVGSLIFATFFSVVFYGVVYFMLDNVASKVRRHKTRSLPLTDGEEDDPDYPEDKDW